MNQAHGFLGVISDAIACGCVLAGILPWLRSQKLSGRSFSAGGLVILMIPLIDHRNHPRIHLLVIDTTLNLCICYCIARYTEFPQTIGGRFLNNRALAGPGRISYSMYLWQQLFLSPNVTALLQTFPVNVFATFSCDALSYLIVEKPLANLRKRLRPRSAQSDTTVIEAHGFYVESEASNQ
jgi:peptidoglycan/LPS O-acetylase OafA/YrhL